MVLLRYRWEALLGGMIIGEEMIRYSEYIIKNELQIMQLQKDLLLTAIALVVYLCIMLCYRSDKSLRWLLMNTSSLALRGKPSVMRTLLEKGVVSGGFLYMAGMFLIRGHQKVTIFNLLCFAVVVLLLLIPRLIQKQ